MRAHRAALQAGSDLSLRFQAFLQGKAPGDLGEWLQSVMAHSRSVFQPWSMEILFLAGIQGSARFSTLESMLGISSRTLSDKLSGLVEAGLLERIVEPGPPLRTSYRLSRHGRATVAAASPLFSHLTLASVRPQAALPP